MLRMLLCLVLVQSFVRLPGGCELTIKKLYKTDDSPLVALTIESVGAFTDVCWDQLFAEYADIKKQEDEHTLFEVYVLNVPG